MLFRERSNNRELLESRDESVVGEIEQICLSKMGQIEWAMWANEQGVITSVGECGVCQCL